MSVGMQLIFFISFYFSILYHLLVNADYERQHLYTSTTFSQRRSTSSPVPPSGDLDETSLPVIPLVPPSCELDETCASSLTLAYSLHYTKTGQLSLLSSVGQEMSTVQSAVMRCGWGLKAGSRRLIPFVDRRVFGR